MLAILKRVPGAKFLLFLLFVFLFINLVLLQSSPLVESSKSITPDETKLASRVAKKLADKLASSRSSIAITIKENELAAVAKMASHLLPKTDVVITTSNVSVLVASSTQAKLPFTRYLNVICLVSQTGSASKLHDCKIGYLPIYGAFLEWLALSGFSLVLGEDFSNTAEDLLANIEYSNSEIKLQAKKSKFLKQQVNASMSKIGDLASTYQQNATVDKRIIQRYLDELNTVQSSELAPYLGTLFALAQERSKQHDPIEENTAILWALAIKFGNYQFASLMGVNANKSHSAIPTTRGRIDLTQHFIYSAILDQLGDLDVGLAVGEAKELLDSLKGGSGFSFSDLAADKAGLVFSNFITNNRSNALKAQQVLANIQQEDAYFPFIHDLPDGFRDENYQRVLSSIDSENYRYVEQEVDKRIDLLALYSKSTTPTIVNNVKSEQWLKPNPIDQYKFWYKVDTHIHSKFSDGSYTIDKITEKAHQYGCDAIAITDHGDHNLKGVLSNDYFNAVAQANQRFSTLTVMPGLEWNIPPFRGREHVTLILPDTPNQQRNLIAFRNSFDQFKRYDEKLLSPEQAFQWLTQYGSDETDIKPFIMYNHPNRKNFQQRETTHDIKYWRQFSDLMIGFSGAPGHQKKQGKKNGSYNGHIKTHNGWDPSVAVVGGEWDSLLQQGYKVWAARAASDFHSAKSDYWPCQFSSTHVLSQSNSQNAILNAFQTGAYWAQQGNFVKSLTFTVATENDLLIMGNAANVERGELVNVNIEVELNHVNWQSEPTTLDELELIIITEHDIRAVTFDSYKVNQKSVMINYPYTMKASNVVFRLRGKSKSNNQRGLLFYSNPIKLFTD